VNHTLEKNRFKATAFYSNLNNEIFLDKTVDTYGTNRNLNQSHKYGLELNDYFAVNSRLSLSAIYNFVVAVVDNNVTDSGLMITNKILPGTPKHNLVVNLNYKFYENATLNLNQNLRSGAYAYDDFQNNFSQKQGPYQTTNIALNYQYKNMHFFTAINNLFAHENSIQLQNNVIYPVDFVRTWRVGMKADF
jgi:iron complex outermembrane receptor protein